jgi:membrane protease YdiL (CAAX protease family)
MVVSSKLFLPRLGIGTNLWINEFIYMLLPPLLIAKVNGWSVEEVYKFKGTSTRNKAIGIFSGSSLWFFSFYISNIIRILMDKEIGTFTIPQHINTSVYQNILFLIGLIVLAPICEEIFFRGFIQKAYENRSKSQGFVIAGLIFGSFHILNGISEVIPACILGLGMGYLAFKTDSILTSMLFHAAANTSAVFIGGVLQTHIKEEIPIWLHFIAFAGIGLTLILLKSLKPETQMNEHVEVYKEKKGSAIGFVFLGLSAILLCVVGVIEILVRLSIIK